MKPSIKGLKRKIWSILREAVILRDDGKCQVCGNRENLQVDHAFSRKIGILHFEINNLTTLCSKCHTEKSFKKGGAIAKRVDEIVRKRHPMWWKWALEVCHTPCPNFSKRWWLEEQLGISKELLEFYKRRVE